MSQVMPAVDLDRQTRARLTRILRAEASDKAEALHAGGVMAEARQALRRQDRVRAAIDRMQPFVTRIESHLRKELNEAARQGDHNRALRVELEIDELFREFNKMAQGLAEDCR
jgi:hypothetical protein